MTKAFKIMLFSSIIWSISYTINSENRLNYSPKKLKSPPNLKNDNQQNQVLFSYNKGTDPLVAVEQIQNNEFQQLKYINVDQKTQNSVEYKKFVGTNLFDGNRKKCFTIEESNLLAARRDFEMMIPRDLPEGLPDDKTVKALIHYFDYAHWVIKRLDDNYSRRIVEKAFYDTLGGFIRYYLLPVSKFSFYANNVELKTVRNVMALYKECRTFLNTNGNGWRAPMRNPLTELNKVYIKPFTVRECNAEKFDDPEKKHCADLDLSTAFLGVEIIDENMIVALPNIECEDKDGKLNNIWLPFSRKRTYNLQSFNSAYILAKFYRSVSLCYMYKAVSQTCFDQKFKQWIVENLQMHLSDEEFYPGLGGVLNIYEHLCRGENSKDISKRTSKDEFNVKDPKRHHRSRKIIDSTEEIDGSTSPCETSDDSLVRKLSNHSEIWVIVKKPTCKTPDVTEAATHEIPTVSPKPTVSPITKPEKKTKSKCCCHVFLVFFFIFGIVFIAILIKLLAPARFKEKLRSFLNGLCKNSGDQDDSTGEDQKTPWKTFRSLFLNCCASSKRKNGNDVEKSTKVKTQKNKAGKAIEKLDENGESEGDEADKEEASKNKKAGGVKPDKNKAGKPIGKLDENGESEGDEADKEEKSKNKKAGGVKPDKNKTSKDVEASSNGVLKDNKPEKPTDKSNKTVTFEDDESEDNKAEKTNDKPDEDKSAMDDKKEKTDANKSKTATSAKPGTDKDQNEKDEKAQTSDKKRNKKEVTKSKPSKDTKPKKDIPPELQISDADSPRVRRLKKQLANVNERSRRKKIAQRRYEQLVKRPDKKNS